MKRLMLTIHAGGIHVDEENAAATENNPTVQYPQNNWHSIADFKTVADLEDLVQRMQREVGAGHAVKTVTQLPQPPEAA